MIVFQRRFAPSICKGTEQRAECRGQRAEGRGQRAKSKEQKLRIPEWLSTN